MTCARESLIFDALGARAFWYRKWQDEGYPLMTEGWFGIFMTGCILVKYYVWTGDRGE